MDKEKGKKVAGSPHKVTLDKRETLNIGGVLSVVSFNENSVTAETEMGVIVVKGGGLKVGGLNVDAGTLLVSGRVDGFSYHEDLSAVTKTLFGKIFK